MTPHINADLKDIAPYVLMPGDPIRAKNIADKYLENVKLVSDVRNMWMFTGTYKGIKITIAGSGMGCPSIGIYSYELYKFYNVKVITRIGSCGAYDPAINLLDVINVKSAFTESNYIDIIVGGSNSRVINADLELKNTFNEVATKEQLKLIEGIIHSSDVFYRHNPDDWKKIFDEHKCIGVEMESAVLFANAKALNKKAACLLTVSDSFHHDVKLSADERATKFHLMFKIALDGIVAYHHKMNP